MQDQSTPCACGCGKSARDGSRFLRGHNIPRRQVTLTCEHCGVSFSRSAGQVRKRAFCSEACYRAPRAEVICAVCGVTFRARPSAIAQGRDKTCSFTCGRVLTAQKNRLDPVAVLWERTQKSEGCWEWNGGTDNNGYGIISGGGNGAGNIKTHRLAWAISTGEPIPDGLHVLHTCDNRRCVRNDELGTHIVNGVAYERRGHLFLGDQRINNADRDQKRRSICHTRPDLMTRRGSAQTQAKLTESDVLEIKRHLRDRTATHKNLAATYGVSKSLIAKIAYGEDWTHVTLP